MQQFVFNVCNSKYRGNSVEVCALQQDWSQSEKTYLDGEYPKARQTKKIKGKNVIILVLVIASRYTDVKPLASGHNEREWNSKEYNLISFINPVLSMRYPSFWRKIVLCNFWQSQGRVFTFYKGLYINILFWWKFAATQCYSEIVEIWWQYVPKIIMLA